ncbi:hypothetical protein ACLB2K_000508 [Fragaria x ananassa]
MPHDQRQPKWEGKACAEIRSPKAEQVWPLLEDFFGLHKWLPALPTCLPVQGVSGQPGCVRYCAGVKTPVDLESDQPAHWSCKQQLLSIDPSQMTLSYCNIDGNIGFNSYIATMRVLLKEDGCSIEWKYEVEPIEGWTLKDLDMLIGTDLQEMASRMEASLNQ